MNDVVLQDMKESSTKFMQLVAPIVKEMLKYGGHESEIMQVEHIDEELAQLMDVKCGIDYVILYEDIDLCYGIAARVQKERNWKTFTIRESRKSGAKTEREKRELAIKHNGIYPKLTIQSYVQDGEVLGVAIMSTKDLFNYIKMDSPYMKRLSTHADKHGQAVFIVCPWDDIINRKFRIFIYDKYDGIKRYAGQ